MDTEIINIELSLMEVIFLLENCHYLSPFDVYSYRFLSYKLSGGKENVLLALKWIGIPTFHPKTIEYKNAKKTLMIFKKIWNNTKETPKIHSELNGRIAQIICNMDIKWKEDDLNLLSSHYKNLQKTIYVGSIKEEIDKIKQRKWVSYSNLMVGKQKHKRRTSPLSISSYCLFLIKKGRCQNSL